VPKGSATTLPKGGNATKLVDEWAACERSHGDPNQADPIIDAYGVINITTPPLGAGGLAGGPQNATGTCSEYLAAAQSLLRAANPVPPPPDQVEYLRYVTCMRANGVPNFPYPTGDKTNFNGTGVDPNSPFVQKVNKGCGKNIGAPAWWISGNGPPGDVSVSSAEVSNGGQPRAPLQVPGAGG